MLKKLKRMYPHQTLMMIFIIGLVTIAGSFTVEHLFNVKPCDMCLWQRYLVITITIVAFIGTLFRGKIKKWFLATISLAAAASLTVGVWQSLAQHGFADLPGACQAPVQTNAVADTTKASADLMASLKADDTGYVDCSKIEDFFLNNITKELMGTDKGVSLANLNVLLMLFIGGFSFYKLFFKPRKRFRRYNNRRNNNRNNNRPNNNNNRRYRGSGYHRSNNRGNKRNYNNNNSNNRRNNEN